MSIKKGSINFAPKVLVYRKLIIASVIIVCITFGMMMCGLGVKTYQSYTGVIEIEDEVAQMQQVVDNSRLSELEALRVQYAELTQNAGENGSFIPTTKYTYTEMINFVNSHLPSDFYVKSVEGTLSNTGVYSYNITIYAEKRQDISGYLRELQAEDIVYCTMNSVSSAQVNVGTDERPEYAEMWVYTVNMRVGGVG